MKLAEKEIEARAINKLISLEVPKETKPKLKSALMTVVDRAVYEVEVCGDEIDLKFAEAVVRVFQAAIKK